MSLVNPKTIIEKAEEKECAVAAFNVYNMETIQAVVEGAVLEEAPVIIQTSPSTIKYAGLNFISANVKAAAKNADIPVALHLDHCKSYELVIKCLRNGYTSIMVDGADLEYNKNINLVKKSVEAAHAVDVIVEGEIGRIGLNRKKKVQKAVLTIPEEAQQFVKDTGIDILAIAIGTVHGQYAGEPNLDFDRLEEINNLIDIPLVLHGASGVDDTSLKKAIKLGIRKINFATDLKVPMAQTIENYFKENSDSNDPRDYLGAGKKAVIENVRKKLDCVKPVKYLKEVKLNNDPYNYIKSSS
ncbi:MAG: class II fructose-bisphosphate aldolase [Halanaerobiales bacterium]|nr:class II fructose-bisphosphate aldolase [Halanaerobiales bacterium]